MIEPFNQALRSICRYSLSLATSEHICLYPPPDMHSVHVQKVISSSSQITDCQSLVFLHRRVLRQRKGGMHWRRWVITLVFLPLMGSDMAPEGQSNQASARSSKRNDQHSCSTVTHGASKRRLQSIGCNL